ncbi:MAG: IS1 family transposase [Gemmatimonadales bacterium]
MNQLSLARRAQIVKALVEGNSVRATCRLTGASKNTVIKLLVDLGEMCSTYQDHKLRNIVTERVQCDEIWSFVGAKRKNVLRGAKGAGDIYTWTAMATDSKLMISWLVGRRNTSSARHFMADLESRLARRVQLTTDGFYAYPGAVDAAFGSDVDYGTITKIYGRLAGDERTYSPPVCIGAIKEVQTGDPDPDHISTSFVERQNLTMRMGMRRFTRLTNAFSRKVENHAHAVALHFMHYNFCRAHTTLTKAHPRRYPVTPAMAAGLTDHVWTVEEMCALLDPTRLLQ